MNTHLIITGNTVVNAVLWDGETDWTPPEGSTVIPAPEGIGIGWILIDDEWVAPPDELISGPDQGHDE